MSRAYTAKEMRERFLEQARILAGYWAGLRDKTPQEVADGVAFSILNVIDGTSAGLPAMDLVLSPHPDDKAYHEAEGENWPEPGQVINAGCLLHELYYQAREPVA